MTKNLSITLKALPLMLLLSAAAFAQDKTGTDNPPPPPLQTPATAQAQAAPEKDFAPAQEDARPIQQNDLQLDTTAQTRKLPKAQEYEVPLSGIVLMPTALRGRGVNTLGPSLDINAAYYIGRLYGKNKASWSTRDTNYLDRIGLWTLSVDGKLLVQTEKGWRPAMAVGAIGMITFRDSSQAKLDSKSMNVSVSKNNTPQVASAYVVLSEHFGEKLIGSVGYMDGSYANFIPQLSEYLSPEALALDGMGSTSATSRSVLFGGLIWMIKPKYPIGIEFVIPQGAPKNPKLINLHLGSLLHMNFEISLLTYQGGYDVLGMFQFRYNFFPK